MPVRYDPLVTRVLAHEILSRWGGVALRSLRFDRGRRVVSLAFDDRSRLLALLHPLAGHLIGLDARARIETELGGKLHRFGRLMLSDVEAPADERALLLTFSDAAGQPREGLAFELQTQRWNAVRLEFTGPETQPVWRIEAALLSRDAGHRPLRRGAPYQLPVSTRNGINEVPSEEAWLRSLEGVDETERRSAVLRSWAWASTLNVDWILAGEAPRERLSEVHSALEAPPPRAWLGERRWGPQPYPRALEDPGGLQENGLLDTFLVAANEEGGIDALLEAIPTAEEEVAHGEAQLLIKRLRSRLKRLGKRTASLQRQLEAAGPPEEPRSAGQLLLARKSEIARGSASVALEDFDGSTRRIELDSALDVVANAERLFDEARRRERALEKLPTEIATAQDRHDKMTAAIVRVEESGPSESLWELVGGKPSGTGRKTVAKVAEPRLAYTRLVSSGGLEIRVGRGAKDNDELTFRNSAPDDIWLHASQSSGAHVILRWGRKDENPPRSDLLEAAVAAAVNSGARNSGTVAVVWTRRKHVRKPRKSPPGTVVPERAQTIFVKPDERLMNRLRPSAD